MADKQMSDKELIKEMAATLQESIEVQKRYSESLRKLKEENELLTQVILRHRLSSEVIRLQNHEKLDTTPEEMAEEFKKKMHIE